MDFTTAVKKVLLENYVNFQGRAPRSEYWWFALFILVAEIAIMIVFSVLASVLGDTGATIGSLLYGIFGLGIILPSLAVTVRRLHDGDRSGWWIFISVIPVIGPILLIVWYCTRGTVGPNQFGPDPLGT